VLAWISRARVDLLVTLGSGVLTLAAAHEAVDQVLADTVATIDPDAVVDVLVTKLAGPSARTQASGGAFVYLHADTVDTRRPAAVVDAGLATSASKARQAGARKSCFRAGTRASIHARRRHAEVDGCAAKLAGPAC
jgi:hypothetical protein